MFRDRKSGLVLPLCAFLLGAYVFAVAEEAPKRLYLTENSSSGGAKGLSSADMIKAVYHKCSDVVITNDKAKADYVLEIGHAWCCTTKGQPRGYKFALFNKDGDAVFAAKTHALGGAVRDVCNAMNAGKPKK